MLKQAKKRRQKIKKAKSLKKAGRHRRQVNLERNISKRNSEAGTRTLCERCGRKFKRFTYGQQYCEPCRYLLFPKKYTHYCEGFKARMKEELRKEVDKC